MESLPPAQVFEGVSSIDDVASLVGSTAKQLRYLLYARAKEDRYITFTIAKKGGGERQIMAPQEDLKIIQRRLADFLQNKIKARPSAHGFVRERSIVSNASKHVHHRIVFNLDLKDFFPSINFGRVRGLFMAIPFGARERAATILAQICCHEGALPQGAPTSPVISNLICSRMDAQLQQLAKKYKCVYTRYADDITFSKRKQAISNEIVKENLGGEMSPGNALRDIIKSNGFTIHPDKVRICRNIQRQSVTGLIVNTRVNVPREFIRDIRAMICDWRRRGLEKAEETHHAKYYKHPSNLFILPPLQRIIEGKLNFLKMVVGIENGVRRNLQRQLVDVWPEYQKTMEKKIVN